MKDYLGIKLILFDFCRSVMIIFFFTHLGYPLDFFVFHCHVKPCRGKVGKNRKIINPPVTSALFEKKIRVNRTVQDLEIE